MNIGQNALARISRSVWELNEKVRENPENYELRRDLLEFFHESRIYLERKHGVSEEDRSFLLLQKKEAICCFLLHGAGGSPREMRELGNFLYSLGYTVFAPRLNIGEFDNEKSSKTRILVRLGKNKIKGREKLKQVASWGGMLSDIKTAFEVALTYDPNTIAFGFSFGGAVALDIARRYKLQKAVLISPALVIKKMGRYLFFKTLKKLSRKIAMRISPAEFLVIDYIDNIKNSLGPIDSALLVLLGRRDPVISAGVVKMLRKLSTNEKSRFVLLDSSRHVIVNGEESREVFEYCREFLSS